MPRTYSRCEHKARSVDIRRQQVITAARQLFVENGFDGTGIAQISKASEIAVAQIYRDFQDKQDIILSIVRLYCQSYIDTKTNKINIYDMSTDQAIEWLAEFIIFDKLKDDMGMFISIVGESIKNEQVLEIFRASYTEIRDKVAAVINIVAPNSVLSGLKQDITDRIMILSLGLLNLYLLDPLRDNDEILTNLATSITHDLRNLHASALLLGI